MMNEIVAVWVRAAACCIALSCSARPAAEQSQPPATTAPAPAETPLVPTNLATAPGSAQPTPVATTAPVVPGTSQTPSAPALEKRFLPHEASCSSDAECSVTVHGLDERFFCCDACEAVAGTKAWVARADALCAAYHRGKNRHVCPPRSCAPPRPARCDAGRCATS